MQARLLGNVLAHDPGDVLFIGNRHMERTDVAVALNQRNDRAFVGGAGPAALGEWTAAGRLGADLGFLDRAVIGFVGLNDFALATERPKAARTHCFADTVAHEPRRFLPIELNCPLPSAW